MENKIKNPWRIVTIILAIICISIIVYDFIESKKTYSIPEKNFTINQNELDSIMKKVPENTQVKLCSLVSKECVYAVKLSNSSNNQNS